MIYYLIINSKQSKGLHSLPRLVLFTSADAHYSIKKLASFMGIGTDNVYLINTDDIGKMDTDHLGKFLLKKKEKDLYRKIIFCFLWFIRK